MNILKLVGDKAFFGDIGRGKKTVKIGTNSTKNHGAGKESNLDGFGTVFKPFFPSRQGAKHCNLRCFCKFGFEKKIIAMLYKNTVNSDVFEGAYAKTS